MSSYYTIYNEYEVCVGLLFVLVPKYINVVQFNHHRQE